MLVLLLYSLIRRDLLWNERKWMGIGTRIRYLSEEKVDRDPTAYSKGEATSKKGGKSFESWYMDVSIKTKRHYKLGPNNIYCREAVHVIKRLLPIESEQTDPGFWSILVVPSVLQTNKRYFWSGALHGIMLLVRIIENNKMYAYFMPG